MIAISADPHFGRHKEFDRLNEFGFSTRLNNILAAFVACCNDALNNHQARHLVVAGDFLHQAKSIDDMTAHIVAYMLQDIAQHFASIHIIAGNHDYAHENYSLLSLFEMIDNIKVVKANSIRYAIIDGLKIALMGWCKDPKYMKYMMGMLDKVDVLIGHAEIQGALNNDNQPNPHGLDAGLFKAIPLTLLGHWHKRQQIGNGNIFYIGSPLQHNFGECTNPTGYCLLDQSGDIQFVDIGVAPKFMDLYEGSLQDDNLLKNRLLQSYCRIEVKDETARQGLLEHIRSLDIQPLGYRIVTAQAAQRLARVEKVGGKEAPLKTKMKVYLQKEYTKHDEPTRKRAYKKFVDITEQP